MSLRSLSQVAVAAAIGVLSIGSVPVKADGYEAGGGYRPAVAGYNWGGLYVGAHAGYSWADLDWALDYPYGTAVTNAPTHPSSSFSSDQAVTGGHIGIQRQFSNWVIGGELSLTSGFKTQHVSAPLWFGNTGGTLSTDIGWLFTATGRIGYASDRWLGYVKGGYAGAYVRLDANDHVPPEYGFETRDFHNGWTVGAGAEYALMKSVILGLEYNYVNLGDSLSTPVMNRVANTPLGSTAFSNVDTTIHSVMARLSFKLDHADDKAEPLK